MRHGGPLSPGRERSGSNPSIRVMPPGVELLEAAEGVPILEPTLIARTLRPVFPSHEGGPISPAQGIDEASFLRQPACAFLRGNRWELLLEPAPFNA